MMGCLGGGSHVSQISPACLRNGCFLEPLRDVRGVWECVCSWGLAQIHTFILSLFLCKYSAQTLAWAAVRFLGFSGCFRAGVALFSSRLRVHMSLDVKIPWWRIIFSWFVLIFRIDAWSSTNACFKVMLMGEVWGASYGSWDDVTRCRSSKQVCLYADNHNSIILFFYIQLFIL